MKQNHKKSANVDTRSHEEKKHSYINEKYTHNICITLKKLLVKHIILIVITLFDFSERIQCH